MSNVKSINDSLPEGITTALIISPHPDDETLGCGGTIALYADRITFTVVVLSNGEALNIEEMNIAEIRKRELMEAMKILGVSDILYLNIPDGKFLMHTDEIKKSLSEIYNKRRPDIVFTPSPHDTHPDHSTAANVCIDLIASFPSVKLAFYESFGPFRFNTLIDIGDVVNIKNKSLNKYHYSMLKKEDIFISSCLSLNKAKSVVKLNESFYEAFLISDDIRELFSSPEERLLQSIKSADTIVSHLQEAESVIANNNNTIKEMTNRIQNLESLLAETTNSTNELIQKLDLIEGSFLWKCATFYYKARDILFPMGSRRKWLFSKVVSLIKKMFS